MIACVRDGEKQNQFSANQSSSSETRGRNPVTSEQALFLYNYLGR